MGWATAHFQFCVVTLQWCRDGRGAAHTTGESVRTTEDLRASAGLPREGCRDRPPWALYHDREFSIATELAHPVSRHGFLVSLQGVEQQGPSVSRPSFGFMTGPGLWAVSRQVRVRQKSSIATENSPSRQDLQCFLSRHTSQGLLSRQSLHDPMLQQRFLCRNKAWGWDGEVRAQQRAVHAQQSTVCTRQTCDSALCCALCYALFGVTVHGHCS